MVRLDTDMARAVLVSAIWLVLNISLNFVNKWALGKDGPHFTFPCFLTMWHMVRPGQRARACAPGELKPRPPAAAAVAPPLGGVAG